MYGLLTFPSSEFDLEGVTECVGPCVTDPKKRVRHAAMECLAVLAQCLGATRAVRTIRDVVKEMNVGTMFDTGEVWRGIQGRIFMRSAHSLGTQ